MSWDKKYATSLRKRQMIRRTPCCTRKWCSERHRLRDLHWKNTLRRKGHRKGHVPRGAIAWPLKLWRLCSTDLSFRLGTLSMLMVKRDRNCHQGSIEVTVEMRKNFLSRFTTTGLITTTHLCLKTCLKSLTLAAQSRTYSLISTSATSDLFPLKAPKAAKAPDANLHNALLQLPA